MLFIGRRLRNMKTLIAESYRENPYLHFAIGLYAFSSLVFAYKISIRYNSPESELNIRHKSRYVVVRPDDPRVETYPRKYITDIDVLDNYLNQNKK